jgi:hypothetical protein
LAAEIPELCPAMGRPSVGLGGNEGEVLTSWRESP